jgi:HTH-like domain
MPIQFLLLFWSQPLAYIWSFRIPGDCVSFADEFSCARGFHQYLGREKMPDKGMGRVSDMALLTHIKAIHAETRGTYGWPRIWRELRQRNVRVGKERVRRMMRDNAIRAREAKIQSDDRQQSWFAGFG